MHSNVSPRYRDVTKYPTQVETLIAFRAFVTENKRAPAYSDLAAATGHTLPVVRQTLNRLTRRGYLEKTGSRYTPFGLTTAGTRKALELERGKKRA